MRQIWRCCRCGTERQWGSLPLAQAQAAVREAHAHQEFEDMPVLGCLTCKDAIPHLYARDEFGQEEAR